MPFVCYSKKVDILTRIYDLILGFFPTQYHWAVSLFLLLAFLLVFVHFIRKSILFIVLLVLFVPASVPVIKNLLSTVLAWMQGQL